MQSIMRKARKGGIVVVVVCLGYVLGPRPDTPRFDPLLLEVMPGGQELDSFVAAQEAKWKLKPDNEARIIWNDPKQKNTTEYAIVYLHGFSASQEEGDPVHTTVAKSFGCNLYLSRLSMHGIDTSEQLLGLTAENYWESAKHALAIGKKLGRKVILMGTSTGGTQALQLAAAYPQDVSGLILLSPNIAINDPNAWLLNNPWGLQIARLVLGSKYNVPKDARAIYKRYWNSPYRIEAAVELQEMLEASMNSKTFRRISQPLLLMYYYKDEDNQDKVVRVDAMLKMFNEIATPGPLKIKAAIPNAGDHVIGSYIKSGDVESVIKQTKLFLLNNMKLPAIQIQDTTYSHKVP